MTEAVSEARRSSPLHVTGPRREGQAKIMEQIMCNQLQSLADEASKTQDYILHTTNMPWGMPDAHLRSETLVTVQQSPTAEPKSLE